MHYDPLSAKRSHHVRKSVTAGTRGYSVAAHGHVGERRGTGRAPPASAVRSRVRHACGTGRGPGRRALHTAPLPASGTGPHTSGGASEPPSPCARSSRVRRPPTGARRARRSRARRRGPPAFGRRRGAERPASSPACRPSPVPHIARTRAPEGAVDAECAPDAPVAHRAIHGHRRAEQATSRRALACLATLGPQMSQWLILVHIGGGVNPPGTSNAPPSPPGPPWRGPRRHVMALPPSTRLKRAREGAELLTAGHQPKRGRRGRRGPSTLVHGPR